MPETFTPLQLADHLRTTLDAAWVALKFDSFELAVEYTFAPAEESAETRTQLIKHCERAASGRKFSRNGTNAIYSRRAGRQHHLFTRVKMGEAGTCLIVVAVNSQSERRIASAQKRFEELVPFVRTIVNLMMAAIRDRQIQESTNLIHQVSRNVAALQPLDKLIPQVVATIRETFNYDAVSLMLLSPNSASFLTKQVAVGEKVVEFLGVEIPITDALEGGIVGYVAFTGLSLLVPDVTQEPRYLKFVEETRCELAVPLKVGERIIGVLDVESSKLNSLDESDKFVLEALADQVAIAIENARLYGELSTARDQIELKTHQLHQLLTRTINIQEEERKRISAELHDGVTQLLVSSLYEIQAGRAMLPRNSESSEAKIASGQEYINEALNEMHRAIHDLRPLMHGDIGMAYAIRKLVTTFMGAAGIEQAFEIVGEPYKLSPDKEIAAYRISQEALKNIVKHSNATRVQVLVRFEPEQALLDIADDGAGFSMRGHGEPYGEENLGLVNMQERAITIGGHLDVASTLGEGTTVRLVIPRHTENQVSV